MSSNVPPPATQAADTVINDFYNREDYVRRRAHFLGRHDAYKNVSVFPIARGDAERVFADENEVLLSVQEVQRRETASGFEDLLPLPTTANTQTMDNFRLYPDQEWTPNSYPVRNQPDPQDTPSLQPSPIASAQLSAAASGPAPRASSAPSGEDTDEDEASPYLEAIIAGTRLPINLAEARSASEIRRSRIGDLQPEFFTAEDFFDDGEVRCVCGLTENDGMPMTACEGCGVWQHIACVGPAYYEGMGDYFCQMCNPFVHRQLIARLRREG
ncbi:hypothetical protein KC332_g4652 [Hortaea werneckii]|nr:hypothetical protein KC358_g11024 [Hortaea werneckii]KAI6930866.1 hypothetical protein KC341_g9951 [Hortaea werneckii]KAI6940975.1 hypothetical protein KC348_g4846 [Hortaea werneckii]KAI6975187.1 hypothetical protein KC321_g4707 [Hortaea werneckii]KAI7015873.1 hypothetical protein KC366_g15313 [Hortaea werneckii]